nr:MAG TPA: hypothetical protein [Caudoviricetes sp.]
MPLQGQVKSWLAHSFGSACFMEYGVKKQINRRINNCQMLKFG